MCAALAAGRPSCDSTHLTIGRGPGFWQTNPPTTFFPAVHIERQETKKEFQTWPPRRRRCGDP